MPSDTERRGGVLPRLCLLLLCGLPSACAELPSAGTVSKTTPIPQSSLLAASAQEPAEQPGETLPSSLAAHPAPAAPDPNVYPFSGEAELSVGRLIEEVLARNPSLAQMVAAWQAASARYPQVTSLDDPIVAGTIGPETIHSDDPGVEFASRLEISQKFPWPGKLALRGANALAEARAAGNEVESVRLQLLERAKDAFYELYLVCRALEINEENLRLLCEFRKDAETRYKTGLAPQQDVLQAEVEIGQQQERQETLERMRQVAIARINTLMNLPPDAPLPPPPKDLKVTDGLPDAQSLRTTALSQRPELLALANRIQAEEAALGLAYKDYYPDFEPFLMYDRFMGNVTENRDLATMLGVRLNLPVRLARRDAAVAEAQARIAERRAELAKQVNQVGFEVQQAYAQVEESKKNVRLYLQTVLPAAEQNLKAAQSAYVTAKIPFLSLIEAERELIRLRDRYEELVADYYRRLAALERAVGGPLKVE
jgi:cobalt-zinc-cadmium efflux system outer membrane protein